MKQIQMNQSKNLSVDDAYDLFIRKCRVKNLSQASIVSYENKIQPFVDYCEGGLIGAVTIDTVDGFTNHLKTEHNGVNVTSIHSFRHTFAKNWILSGGDIVRLKTIMGHSNIAVTNEYLAMFGQDLQMDFEKFNPLDNLKNRNREQIRM